MKNPFTTRVPAWVAAAVATLAFALGNGWLFDWQSLRQQGAANEVDKLVAVSELQRRQIEVLREADALAAEIEAMRTAGHEYSSPALRRLVDEFRLVRRAYDSVEASLADLQGRRPEPLRYEPGPPRPPTLELRN